MWIRFNFRWDTTTEVTESTRFTPRIREHYSGLSPPANQTASSPVAASRNLDYRKAPYVTLEPDSDPSHEERPWNINIHYDGLLDSLVSSDAHDVLDVGCGDGFLAARLARRIARVTALDVDEPVLQRAEARFPDVPVRWMNGDVAIVDLPEHSFDAVVSNATLHHLGDTRAALRRLSALVRPGGTLALVTFVKPSAREAPYWFATWVSTAVVKRLRGSWRHTAPVSWPPPETLRQLRNNTHAALPDAQVRRLLYNRILITWRASPSS
ncbi:MAG: methyltransferase domain-containing protein [Rhodococcus sp.]|jgi:2-polyprenyl-3-methyl-5-hydroxy-6-metoxy-1,4-benzoquinol methylase|nr:class I SAM-dependent methyltransferase [Rhodococcus sp. (in: high G+C Gram-positive bacteria)]MBJ7325393.1 methyltransferase domain-containing protein [Rhodococcus sp. (in: high G+C Gram-positive bacteria)]